MGPFAICTLTHMNERFQHLRIDGEVFSGRDIVAWARAFATAHPDDANGPLLIDLCDALVNGDGTLAAHTSGTTGAPKAIGFPAKDLVASAQLTAKAFDLRAGDRALLCLPVGFIAGRMMIVRAMVLGLDLHLADARGSILDNLRTDDRFRFAAMVPQQLHRAVQEDRSRVERQFERILLGGGPVAKTLEDDLHGLRTHVLHGYGSTETLTHVALRTLNGPQRSNVYEALGAISFSSDDDQRLVIHTPHLTVQEHHTNDLVDLIDRTHFRWLGRYDNVILSGGRKIHPERLEAITSGVLPYAHYFMAVPDERLGQAVKLVIETDRSPEEVLPEVMRSLTAALAKYELPRKVVAQAEFLRTASGKVIRDKS